MGEKQVSEDVENQDEDQKVDDQSGDTGAGADAVDKAEADVSDDQKADDAKPAGFDYSAALDGVGDPKAKDLLSRFDSMESLGKALLDARQKLSKAHQPLGKNATDEEKAEYRKRSGVPDDISGYELPKIPDAEPSEADQAVFGAVAEVAHEHNVSKEAYAAMSAKILEIQHQQEADSANFAEEFAKQSDKALSKEWGRDKDRNMNLASRALKMFDKDGELSTFMDERLPGLNVRIGDHPAFIKAFGRVGLLLKPDDHPHASTVDMKSAKDQIKELEEKNPPGTPGYAKVQSQLQELYRVAYPE